MSMKKVFIAVTSLMILVPTSGALAGQWLQVIRQSEDNNTLIVQGVTPAQQYRSDDYDYLEIMIDTNRNGKIDRDDAGMIEPVRGRFEFPVNVAQYRGLLIEVNLWDRKESELVGNNEGWTKRRGYSVWKSHDGGRGHLD